MITADDKGIADLKKLRHTINENFKRNASFKMHQFIKKLGWNSPDVHGLYALNIVSKDTKRGTKAYIYQWIGGEPSLEMLQAIKKENSKYNKRRVKRGKERKRLKAELDALNAASNKPIEAKKPILVKSGQVFEDLETFAQEATTPQQNLKVESEKPKIPITVDVTTEGDKKTVVIKIIV